MPAKRVCCLSSADRLTSGSLRLLIDTKETGALLAHSLSRTCSRSGKWTLFIRALDDQCGFSKSSPLFSERVGFFFFWFSLLCAATAGVCAATLNALFCTQRMFSNRSSLPHHHHPPLLNVSPFSLCLYLTCASCVRFWLDFAARSDVSLGVKLVLNQTGLSSSGFAPLGRLRWGCSQRLPVALRQRTISIKL